MLNSHGHSEPDTYISAQHGPDKADLPHAGLTVTGAWQIEPEKYICAQDGLDKNWHAAYGGLTRGPNKTTFINIHISCHVLRAHGKASLRNTNVLKMGLTKTGLENTGLTNAGLTREDLVTLK